MYHLPNLNQDKMSNLSKPVTPREIEIVIKSLLTKKAQDQKILVQNVTKH